MAGDAIRAQRDARALLDTLDQEGTQRLELDTTGPAVYRLEPLPMMTALACFGCRYTSLVPSIPRKPLLYWTCPQCKTAYELRPPAVVWVEGSRPSVGDLKLS